MKLSFSSNIDIELLQEVAIREYNGKNYYNSTLIINKEGRVVKKKDGSAVKKTDGTDLLDFGAIYKRDDTGRKTYLGNINYVRNYECESNYVMLAIDQTQAQLDVIINHAFKGPKKLSSTFFFNIEFDHGTQKNDVVGKIQIRDSKDIKKYLDVGSIKFIQSDSKVTEEEVSIPQVQDNEDDLPF